MSTHTPGPWFVHKGVISATGAIGLGTVYENDDLIDAEETDANGRLIAAAPELLSAAKWALDFVAGLTTGCTMDEQRDIHQRLSAAIAKAQGDSDA